jgi:hypothetical protein
MITFLIVAIIVVAGLAALGAAGLISEQASAVRDLQKQRDKLYADNQRLMEALAAQRNVKLDLSPRPTVQELQQRPVPKAPAPHWQSKQSLNAIVGDKVIPL